MKVSIVIPVYYNEENLRPLYEDIKRKVIDKVDYDYEIVMVNDGSKDNSYGVMQELAKGRKSGEEKGWLTLAEVEKSLGLADE